MNKEELHTLIEQSQPNICQIVAYKENKEVYSDTWNNYKDTDCVHIMSATKSIMALLFGIAIDKGQIGSVDDKVLTYFPDYTVKRGEKTIYDVTIRHLLTMRAPYKCKGDPWSKVCASNNWTYSSLDFLGGRKGLTDDFNYQTVCLHILSGILYEATGMNTVDYANKYLFEPLGIKKHRNYLAETAEEHKQFTIEKTPKKDIWFCDPQGLGTPGYGLCMSAKDMAVLGTLVLDHGKHAGKRIISEAYLNDMLSPHLKLGERFGNMNYGYLWYQPFDQRTVYAAIGDSGNIIYVNREANVSVGITGTFKPRIFDRVQFIEQYVLPVIDS